MGTDADLLSRYAAAHDERAFRALVQRYLNLVYSVALRQVGGDAHLAQDVAQRVFADLARKAPALANRATLGGWLHRAAQFAASDLVRAERARRVREQEAELMQELSCDPNAADVILLLFPHGLKMRGISFVACGDRFRGGQNPHDFSSA